MGLLDAVAFLTRIPVPVSRSRVPDLARATVWFPLVGAVLGAVLLGLGTALTGPLTVLVAAVLVVVLELVVTGALHLDGLADVTDGLGGRDRGTRLRIMKDSATGVYGAAAVVLCLVLEVAQLVALLDGATAAVPPTWLLPGLPAWAGVALVGATAWSLSRAAMLPVALALPYARAEGTGRTVVEGLAPRHTLLAWVVPVVLCAVLGTTGAAMLLAALLATAGVGALARRTLGGATGDVLGATAQVALLAALLAAVADLPTA